MRCLTGTSIQRKERRQKRHYDGISISRPTHFACNGSKSELSEVLQSSEGPRSVLGRETIYVDSPRPEVEKDYHLALRQWEAGQRKAP